MNYTSDQRIGPGFTTHMHMDTTVKYSGTMFTS